MKLTLLGILLVRLLWQTPSPTQIDYISWSPDGSRLIASSFTTDGKSTMLDAVTLEELFQLSIHIAPPVHLTWKSDSSEFAVADFGVGITIFDAQTGAPLRSFRLDQDIPGVDDLFRELEDVEGIAWSPDGQFIAFLSSYFATNGDQLFHFRVFDAMTMQEVFTFVPSYSEASTYYLTRGGIAWLPDSQRLMTVNADVIRLWDTETWQEAATFHYGDYTNYPHDNIHFFALSPDGKYFLALANSSLSIREANTFEEVLLLDGSGLSLIPRMWSPDGKYIVKVGDDLQVWNVEKKELIYQIPHWHGNGWGDVTWNPESTQLAYVDENGIIQFINISLDMPSIPTIIPTPSGQLHRTI